MILNCKDPFNQSYSLLKSDCLASIQLAFGSISACYGSYWIPATMGEKFETWFKVGQTPGLHHQGSSMAVCSLVSVWMAGSGCDPALPSDPKNQGCPLLVLWDQQASPGVEGSCCLRNLLPHFTSLLCEAPVVTSAASSVLQRVLLSTWCSQLCMCSLVELRLHTVLCPVADTIYVAGVWLCYPGKL